MIQSKYDILKELENNQKLRYTILKLPCRCGISLQLTKAQDQFVRCPRCLKGFALTWALRDQAKKLREV